MREQDVITPVIFLKGRGDQEIAVQTFRLGATDYLAKSSLSRNSYSILFVTP